jgi:hypothetical protein
MPRACGLGDGCNSRESTFANGCPFVSLADGRDRDDQEPLKDPGKGRDQKGCEGRNGTRQPAARSGTEAPFGQGR